MDDVLHDLQLAQEEVGYIGLQLNCKKIDRFVMIVVFATLSSQLFQTLK